MSGDSDLQSNSEETLDGPTESAQPPSPELRRIRYVGDYELISEIARGGMGIVYRAKQLSLNRIVAVKIIRRAEYATELDRLRFRSEAEAAANLDHPNIVPIYEVGEHDGEPYFSMRLIEGGSLADSIRSGRWPIDKPDTLQKAAKLVATVARAVHAAHQYGILHRDIKPGNILLDASETPFVTDFGLAKRVESETPGFDITHITQTGEIIGTPAFMSPEQASGKKGLTTATDVYSLGAILFSLLAGKSPFQSDSPLDLLQQVVSKAAPSLRKLNPQVDLDLATICQKCLEKEPEKRYSSALEMAEDLERWSRGETIRARPVSKFETLRRWGKRNPKELAMWATVVGAMALLAFILGIGYSTAVKQAAEGRHREYLHDMTNALESIKVGQQVEAIKSMSRYDRNVTDNDDYWEWNYLRNQSRIRLLIDRRSSVVNWNHQLTRYCVHDYLSKKVSIGTFEAPVKNEETHRKDINVALASHMSFDFSLRGWVNNGCWDRTGDFYALIDETEIRLLSATTSSIAWQTKHSNQGSLNQIKWSQSNKLLAVGTSTGFVDVLDATNGQLIRSFECRDEMISGISYYAFGFGPEDRWFAIGSSKGIRFYDSVNGTLIRSTDWSLRELSPDGQWIGNRWGIRNSETGEIVAKRPYGITSRNWSLDGSTCVEFTGSKYQVYHNDFTTLSFEFPSQTSFVPREISHDGSFLIEDAVTSFFLWDLRRRGDSKDWAKPSQAPNAVSLRNNGTLIAYAELMDETLVHIYDGRQYADLGSIRVGSSKVLSVAVHPTQPQLATLDETGALRIWDTDSLTEIKQLEGIPAKAKTQSDSFWKVEYNQDGSQLAAGGGGDQVILWKTDDWTELKRIKGTSYRFIGWQKSLAIVQASNRPAFQPAYETLYRWDNLFQGKSPFEKVLDLPKGTGAPPRENVSHLLFLSADSDTGWRYMPVEFSPLDAWKANSGHFELNAIEFSWDYTLWNCVRFFQAKGRRFELGNDGCLLLKESGSKTRISVLANEVRVLHPSPDRSAILLDSKDGVQCLLAPECVNPLFFSPIQSDWSRLSKDALDAFAEILAVGLAIWFPLFVSVECIRKKTRVGVALTISFLFCALATLLVDRQNLMISHPWVFVYFGIVALLSLPFLLRIAHLANSGKVLKLAMLLIASLAPSLVYFLWATWPSNTNSNTAFVDAGRAGIAILAVLILLYSIFPYYRWFRNRTHPDLKSLNPVVFRFASGLANRTEAWLFLLFCIALSTAMIIVLSIPDFFKNSGLPSGAQDVIRAGTLFIGCIGTIASIAPAIVLYYVYRYGLMKKPNSLDRK